jgi:hypothetical protein
MTLQETEKRLRAADAKAYAELRTAREALETAGRDDVDAAASALLAGAAAPKARAGKLSERIRDLEVRVIPGIDEALWRFVGQVRDELRPDADDNYKRLLSAELKRWQPPDPGRRDRPAPTQHLQPRPKDVVSWVEAGIDRIDRMLSKKRDEAERAERKRAAQRKVDRAQSVYDQEQRIKLDEEEARMSPETVNSRRLNRQRNGAPPWRPFDRFAFLQREGLLEDYGYVQPGAVVQVKGGRSILVEQVPASELADTTNATEA